VSSRVGADEYIVSGGDPTALPRVSLKPSHAQILAGLAAHAEVFQEEGGDTVYASFPVRTHQETSRVRSTTFRRWLGARFYRQLGTPPGAQAMADALAAIEARAQHEGIRRSVSLRLADYNGVIYLDLCDADWRAVEMRPDGWRVVADPPVRFRRTKGMLALPEPVPGGTLDALRPFVNVADDTQWVLLISWLLAALRPTGPYPVLVLHGEHGSAKSTLAEIVRKLIDPNTAPLRTEPREPRDLMIAASNSWCLALDNVSHLFAWLSDGLCRLSTGAGFAIRTLYTDDEETILTAERPVLLTGIEEVVSRPDLLGRALLLALPPLKDRRRQAERELWRSFEIVRPGILGALLDAVCGAMARYDKVTLPSLPRMADFAVWATAAEPTLRWHPGIVMAAYTSNREAGHEVAIEASPIGSLLCQWAGEVGAWTGTAAELLTALSAKADEITRRSKSWPGSPRALSGLVRRLAPTLRETGIEVILDKAREPQTGRRLIQVRQVGGADRHHRHPEVDVGEEVKAGDGSDEPTPTISDDTKTGLEEVEL
jgi:hypothetical protein